MPSIVIMIHRHLRKISLALLVVMILFYMMKLRFLADPMDVDQKEVAAGTATATIMKMTNQPSTLTSKYETIEFESSSKTDNDSKSTGKNKPSGTTSNEKEKKENHEDAQSQTHAIISQSLTSSTSRVSINSTNRIRSIRRTPVPSSITTTKATTTITKPMSSSQLAAAKLISPSTSPKPNPSPKGQPKTTVADGTTKTNGATLSSGTDKVNTQTNSKVNSTLTAHIQRTKFNLARTKSKSTIPTTSVSENATTSASLSVAATTCRIPPSSSSSSPDNTKSNTSSNSYNNLNQQPPFLVLAGTLEAGIPSLSRKLVSLLGKDFIQSCRRCDERMMNGNNNNYNRGSSIFLPKNMPRFISPTDGIQVSMLRQFLWNKEYNPNSMSNSQAFSSKDNNVNGTIATTIPKSRKVSYFLDTTPGYLFWSATVPHQLLCVAPQAKVIVMLRHPVDRAYTQYQSATALGLKVNFTEWVLQDLNVLLFVQQESQRRKERTMDLESWNTYLQMTNGEGPVGRGLYSIQLLQWVQVIQQSLEHKSEESDNKTRNVDDVLLILNYDDWKRHPRSVWNTILEFLDLDPILLEQENEYYPKNLALSIPNTYVDASSSTTTTSVSEDDISATGGIHNNNNEMMDPSIRAQLLQFYKPYNQQLYNMLGWDPIWD